jgi:hypothetical protein
MSESGSLLTMWHWRTSASNERACRARWSALPPHHELNLRVFVRDGEVWRVAAFHNTVVAGRALRAR